MAAKLFLLLIAIGQAMGQLKLNCHIVPENLSQLFDNSTRNILESCDRLIVIAGTPLKDGKLRSMGASVKGHMQNARNTNSDIELLVEVFLRPEHMQPLVNDDYRANVAQSLKDLVLTNDLKGAVVNVDHNYERAEPHVRGKAMIISLLSRVRSHLGQSGVLGLVTGTRGPFDTVEPKNCHNMSPNLDFIELSPESFDLDGRREPKADSSGMTRPIEAGEVDQKAVQLTEELVGKWHKCKELVNKTILTMPLPVGVEENPGQPKAIQMPYVKICNQNATWYEGADLPLMSLSQRNPEGVVQADYWVSLLNSKTMAAIVQYGRENQVAGYSYLPINYDDGPNRCGNGNWPLLSYLHLLMNKIPARVEPKITDKAKLQEICQVVSKYCQGL